MIYEQGKSPFLLILDRISDVRNFGAIARTAECVGVDAIIIPQKGSASINADAVKTSTGALYNIPVCKENNLKPLNFYKTQAFKSSVQQKKQWTLSMMPIFITNSNCYGKRRRWNF